MCTGVTRGFAGVKLSGSLKMCGSFRVNTVGIMMGTGNPTISFTVKYRWNGILYVSLFNPSGLFDPVW
jgi:Mg2+/citrate symporter